MRIPFSSALVLASLVAAATDLAAQAPDSGAVARAFEAASRVERVEVSPSPIRVVRGDTVVVRGVLRDADSTEVRGAVWTFAFDSRDGLFGIESLRGQVPDVYRVWGLEPGATQVDVMLAVPGADGGEPEWRRMLTVPLVVEDLPVERVEIAELAFLPYAGTSTRFRARALTAEGRPHSSATVEWSSSDPNVADIDADGSVRYRVPGPVTFTARADGVEARMILGVRDSGARELRLGVPTERVRTGDVTQLDAQVLNDGGSPVMGIALEYRAMDATGAPTDAVTVYGDGAFVAERPGRYRIHAKAAGVEAVTEVEVFPRGGRREAAFVSQGPVVTATTDLWVFEGGDGRDYAYTGTMRAATMYAWDVTDPARPVLMDSVRADGRRVNDVKINDDATLAIITSENASNRRNGITLLDIADPAHPTVITHYTEGLTAGIHNVWFVGDLVYAVNDGTLDVHIIDVSDPSQPSEVGRWGLARPGRYLHDVSVVDGFAYLSYWDDGLVILDVGNGIRGGTPVDPQFVSSIDYQYDIGGQSYGNTHHAIRYGRYVFLGDEIFGCPGCDGPRGYVHVIDVEDIENPVEVATFELPDAGTHNLWVEDDLLYIAYYQGGLRVVDVSGELRGDLLAQGREVAAFMTEGHDTAAEETMAWGPQPYKGHVFVSDMRSGLWVIRLDPVPVIP